MKRYSSFLMAAVAAMALSARSVQAADGTWTLDNAGNWSTAGNWAGSTVADGTGFSAYLSNVITANRTITLDSGRTIGNIYAQDTTHDYTISGANTLTLDVSSGAPIAEVTQSGRILTISSVVAGNDGLQKSGAGLLTLNAANSYSGATTVNAGELRWGIANAIAGGALNVNAGGTVNLQTFSDTVGTITIANGGTITGTTGSLTTTGSFISNDGGTFSGFSSGAGLFLPDWGAITYNSTGPGSATLSIDRITMVDHAAYFNIADGDAAVDFEITSSVGYGGNNIGHSIYKSGAGVMQFSGTESGTGGQNGLFLVINDGTALLNKADGVAFIPGNYGITIGDSIGSAGTAVLKHTAAGGNNQISNPSITINSDGLFDLNGKNETTTGLLTLTGGSIATGTGTFTLANNITNNASASVSTISGNLNLNNSARTFNVADGAAAVDLDIQAVVTNGAITKIGEGTLSLGGSNTYTGVTTLDGGILLVNGSIAAGSTITFTAGTLGGSGTIAGNVTVPAAGNLAPGSNGAGTLRVGGALNISALDGGKLYFQLDQPTATSDKIAVTGVLTIGNGTLGLSDFNFTKLAGSPSGVYKLITSSGGITGTLDSSDLTGEVPGIYGILKLQLAGNDLEVIVKRPGTCIFIR